MFTRIVRSFVLTPIGLATLALTAPPSLAGDYYVDAVHGNNANSGATPRDAWQTITRAIAALPIGTTSVPEVIHVAPGLYDPALGEVFPYRFQEHDSLQIIGAGSAVTILDGGGASVLLLASRAHHYGWAGPLNLLQGFTLRNAQKGLHLASVEGPIYLTCRDVKFTQLTSVAIAALSQSYVVGGIAHGIFEQVEISSCAAAVTTSTSDGFPSANHVVLTFTDCTIAGNASAGISVRDGQSNGATITCTRTRVTDNALDGIRIEQFEDLGSGGTTSTVLEDCLIARNGGAGVKVFYSGYWMPPYQNSFVATEIDRCTIADNAGIGLDAYFTTIDAGHVQATLDGTILYGNNDDVRENPAIPSIRSVRYCDVGDGDFAGSGGNIAADPLFLDPAGGDFRLRFGSPCVEAGDPATPSGAVDLARNARPIDGNLDILEMPDIGAYEFAPLFLKTSGRVGTPARWESFGPSGGSTTIYFSRVAPVAPMMTPFGEFDLNPLIVGTFLQSGVAPGPPVVFSRMIPLDVSLIGRTFAFQGRTTSSAAPQGFAYTNVVSMLITR